MSEPRTHDSTMPMQSASIPQLTPTCPLCHTLDRSVTSEALRDGAEWACTRCGQTWNAARLARAAAYAEYEATH